MLVAWSQALGISFVCGKNRRKQISAKRLARAVDVNWKRAWGE